MKYLGTNAYCHGNAYLILKGSNLQKQMKNIYYLLPYTKSKSAYMKWSLANILDSLDGTFPVAEKQFPMVKMVVKPFSNK